MNINDQIITIANSYVGKKEKPNNSGFYDENFEKEMESVGWVDGWAWCALFAELVWKKAYEIYKPELIPILDELFDASAVKTYHNFKELNEFEVSKTPVKGSIVIWQNYRNYKPQWTGHAGIIEGYARNGIFTIEGNTNALGGREGDQVAKKTRLNTFETKDKGLVLLGFIHPIN